MIWNLWPLSYDKSERSLQVYVANSTVQKDRAAEAISLAGVKRKESGPSGGAVKAKAQKLVNITINMNNSTCGGMSIYNTGGAVDSSDSDD